MQKREFFKKIVRHSYHSNDFFICLFNYTLYLHYGFLYLCLLYYTFLFLITLFLLISYIFIHFLLWSLISFISILTIINDKKISKNINYFIHLFIKHIQIC